MRIVENDGSTQYSIPVARSTGYGVFATPYWGVLIGPLSAAPHFVYVRVARSILMVAYEVHRGRHCGYLPIVVLRIEYRYLLRMATFLIRHPDQSMDLHQPPQITADHRRSPQITTDHHRSSHYFKLPSYYVHPIDSHATCSTQRTPSFAIT
jgi:hypothetical protein